MPFFDKVRNIWIVEPKNPLINQQGHNQGGMKLKISLFLYPLKHLSLDSFYQTYNHSFKWKQV